MLPLQTYPQFQKAKLFPQREKREIGNLGGFFGGKDLVI